MVLYAEPGKERSFWGALIKTGPDWPKGKLALGSVTRWNADVWVKDESWPS